MTSTNLIITNLTSPAVISFLLGVFASVARSDLRVPAQAYEAISMFLLFSIGLKGGIALSKAEFLSIATPLGVSIFLGILTPCIGYFIARKIGKLDVSNAAALAAHSGSVSAVTYIACLNFADSSGVKYNAFMTALLVVLEILGIVVALILASVFNPRQKIRFRSVLHDCFTGKSVILLCGGLLVGLVSSPAEIAKISHVFISLFHGILVFFMLELGVVATNRIRDTKSSLPFMLGYGIFTPLLFGILGTIAGSMAGMSVGNTAILSTMVASASYIAAPAAVRMALPEANPGIYLTTAISITLPFNIAIGIPTYFSLAAMAIP